MVAIVVGFCFVLMFLFVPETFWDRTPQPHAKSRRAGLASISKIFHHHPYDEKSDLPSNKDGASDLRKLAINNSRHAVGAGHATIAERRQQNKNSHVGFADEGQDSSKDGEAKKEMVLDFNPRSQAEGKISQMHLGSDKEENQLNQGVPKPFSPASHRYAASIMPKGEGPQTPDLHNFNSPFYVANEKQGTDYMNNEHEDIEAAPAIPDSARTEPATPTLSETSAGVGPPRYTTFLRTQPPKTYRQNLKPWNGQLRHENWFLVAFRPFILFAYPSILWSTLVYSLSIGWLIVLSESVASIYRDQATYNFTALQTGLVYISPFIGGVLGTAVAGKVSDVIVRFMSRRNGGIYEPEFRLVMAIPVTISTCVGLMGFGWSAQVKDNWIVPTVFFGIISFGCSLGSTTAITFAVDSYRQYAGEALVTLNFAKSNFYSSHLPPRPC